MLVYPDGVVRARNLSPRKSPIQERSRDTVARILAAATQVLIDHGYEGASTNRIAAQAGISPGSLYQYYPNKDAIIIEVVETYVDELEHRMARRFNTLMNSPPDVMVSETLRTLVDTLEERSQILRTVVEQVPGSRGAQRLAWVEGRVGDMTRGYLMRTRDRIANTDVEAATWILCQLAVQLGIRYVLDEPPIDKDVFIHELTQVVLGYPSHSVRGRSADTHPDTA